MRPSALFCQKSKSEFFGGAMIRFSRVFVVSWIFLFGISIRADEVRDPNVFQYVLVNGFLSEVFVGNFFDNIRALRESGVANDRISVIDLPSSQTVGENSGAVYARPQALAASNSRP